MLPVSFQRQVFFGFGFAILTVSHSVALVGLEFLSTSPGQFSSTAEPNYSTLLIQCLHGSQNDDPAPNPPRPNPEMPAKAGHDCPSADLQLERLSGIIWESELWLPESWQIRKKDRTVPGMQSEKDSIKVDGGPGINNQCGQRSRKRTEAAALLTPWC